MTGLVRKATLLSACGLLLAGAAMASIPSAANSTLPDCDPTAGVFPCVKVVGEGSPGPLGVSGGNVPDPAGQFSITVRDLVGTPMNNVQVAVDFSACGDTRLCLSADGFLGQDVDCANNRVTNTTNASGVALFNIVGGGSNTGNSAGAGLDCAQVFAGGIPLGSVTVIVADQDGQLTGGNGMNVVDISSMIVDLNSGNYYGRSDFEPTGPPLTVVDIAQSLVILNAGDSSIGCNGTPGVNGFCQ